MTGVQRKLLLSAAALTGLLAADIASAQTRVRRPVRVVETRVIETVPVAPPLTIQRRSFLDPGPVVPVGSRSRYVQAITSLAVPVYAEIGVGHGFGYETLPRRFDPPGRPQPLFEFSTGTGGY